MIRKLTVVAALVALQAATGVVAQEGGAAVSLRIDGKEVALSAAVGARLAGLARETLKRCGPNTRQHPGNFAGTATLAPLRRDRTLETSRLHVVYDRPFESVSHLGGALQVSEVTLGLGGSDLFVGPDFTRHGAQVAEHLQCEYLPALEIACLAELAAHLPARYRETCARLARGADGKIVMPPPDIAPSCS
jgi:hypothetical protein